MPRVADIERRMNKLESATNQLGIYDRLVKAKQQQDADKAAGIVRPTPRFNPNLTSPPNSLRTRLNDAKRRAEECGHFIPISDTEVVRADQHEQWAKGESVNPASREPQSLLD